MRDKKDIRDLLELRVDGTPIKDKMGSAGEVELGGARTTPHMVGISIKEYPGYPFHLQVYYSLFEEASKTTPDCKEWSALDMDIYLCQPALFRLEASNKNYGASHQGELVRRLCFNPRGDPVYDGNMAFKLKLPEHMANTGIKISKRPAFAVGFPYHYCGGNKEWHYYAWTGLNIELDALSLGEDVLRTHVQELLQRLPRRVTKEASVLVLGPAVATPGEGDVLEYFDLGSHTATQRYKGGKLGLFFDTSRTNEALGLSFPDTSLHELVSRILIGDQQRRSYELAIQSVLEKCPLTSMVF